MRNTKLLHVGLFAMLAASTACSQQPPTATVPQQAQSHLSAPRSVQQIQQGAMGGNIAANIGANAGLGNLGANLGRFNNVAANVGQLSNVGTNPNMPRTVTTPRNTIPRTVTNQRIFTNNRLLFPYSTYYYPNYYPYYNNYAYAANVVTVQNYAFNPYDISVPIGGSVTWVNNDPVPHTTTSPGMWDGELYPGASFTYTFTRPGNFPYYCRYHPYMRGVVHVGAY